MKKHCLTVVSAALFFSSTCLAADAIVQLGDGQTWTVRHYGRTPQALQSSTNHLRSPTMIVGVALEAAKFSSKPEFSACFIRSEGSDLDSLFQEMESSCKRYTYLVLKEAQSTDGNQDLAAVSTVPFALNSGQQDTNEISGLSPKVFFLVKTNGEWRIDLKVENDRIAEFLMKEAKPQVYRSDTLQSQEQVAAMVSKWDAERRDRIINGMIKAGAPDWHINGLRETFALEERGVVITNWAGWKKQFNCKELVPPIVYDIRDPFTWDFSTPLSAQRSYRHALYIADGKTLSEHVDDAQRKSFNFTYGTNWVTRTKFIVFPKLTKCTVLFTATTKFEGTDYAMVFFRIEQAVTPRNGIVTFQADIFKRGSSGYVKTSDFDNGGTFGNPCRAAGVGPMLIPPYAKFVEACINSEFPAYYYNVEE